MKKMKKFFYLIIVVIVIILVILAIKYFLKQRNLAKELNNLTRVETILIGDAQVKSFGEQLKNNYNVVATITDKDIILEFIKEVSKAKIASYNLNNKTESQYLFRLLDKEQNVIADFTYEPLRFLEFSKQDALKLKDNNYITDLLNNYQIPFYEILEKLNDTKAIVIKKDRDLKTITDQVVIEDIIKILREATVFQNSTTLPGADYEIKFLDDKDREIATMEYGTYITITVENKKITLVDYDELEMETILNNY